MHTAKDHAQSYPASPWKLQGEALLRLQPIRLQHARHWVPQHLKLVSVAPGRTLAGLLLLHYKFGSTVRYHELIVMSGLVRSGAHVGSWISHIYVDNTTSLVAGQEIWGLPKQMAQFKQTRTNQSLGFTVAGPEGLSLSLTARSGKGAWPAPLIAPVLSQQGQQQTRLLSFVGRGWAQIKRATATLDIAQSCPFVNMGFSGGQGLWLQNFSLTLPTPKLHFAGIGSGPAN